MNTKHTPGPWYTTGDEVTALHSDKLHRELIWAIERLAEMGESEENLGESRAVLAAIAKAEGR